MGRRANWRGNATIEFTLVGIPLVFVLISTIEMARGMWIYHTLAYAVKEGTRYAVARGQNNPTPTTYQNVCNAIVQAGTVGFGSIYASVYGSGGSASGFATGRSSTAERGSPGMASLYGGNGTSMQCEFYNDNVTHHGYGGCRTSKDAEFRIQF